MTTRNEQTREESSAHQKPHRGLGASSSPRNAPFSVGAMITLTSWAGSEDSLRTMWPRPVST